MLLQKYLIKKLAILTLILATSSVWAADSKTAPESTAKAETVADVQAVRKPEGNVEDFWNAQAWTDMNATEQALWGKLGWTDINWNSDTQPPSENKAWTELKEEERDAASQLGYTEVLWNQDLVRKPIDNVEDFWNGLDWQGLTPAEKALWEKLGWSQDSWEGKSQIPDSENKKWDTLSTEERDVAQQLGYDEKSWDSTLK